MKYVVPFMFLLIWWNESAAAHWQMIDKVNLDHYLAVKDNSGATMLSKVNGVQVVAYHPGEGTLMVGRLAKRKDAKERWALSAGKPIDHEKDSAAGLESGAYRELREEFGVPETAGVKSDKVLISSASGVKLVYFLALDRHLALEEIQANIARELEASEEQRNLGPEYQEWRVIPISTFEEDLSKKTRRFEWRTFDSLMFGSEYGFSMLKTGMLSYVPPQQPAAS